MKKFIILLIALIFSLEVGAQEFLTVEDVTYGKICVADHSKTCPFRPSATVPHKKKEFAKVILSDGTSLCPVENHYGSPCMLYKAMPYGEKLKDIKTNLTDGRRLKQGDLIYHTGDYYWHETKKFQKQVVIKNVVIREIKGAYNGSINGSFGYNSFFAFVSLLGGGGGGKAKGSVSGSFQGGTYTVANVTFTDGSHASILVTQDGFWYEANPGMKVNVSKLRRTTIYELL